MNRTTVAATIVTLVMAIPAFFLTRVLWPIPPVGPPPSEAQLPLLMLQSGLMALAFGLGVAFIAFGLPLVRRYTTVAGVNPWLVYVSIGWLLVSWWPHIGFHESIGFDLDALIRVDYGFHVPLIVATLIVARFFLAYLRATERQVAY